MDPIEQLKKSLERNKMLRQEEARELDLKYAEAQAALEPIVSILDAVRELGTAINLDESFIIFEEDRMAVRVEWNTSYDEIRDEMILRTNIEGLRYIAYAFKDRGMIAHWSRPSGKLEFPRRADKIVDALVYSLMAVSDLESRLAEILQSPAEALSQEEADALSGLAPVISRISLP